MRNRPHVAVPSGETEFSLDLPHSDEGRNNYDLNMLIIQNIGVVVWTHSSTTELRRGSVVMNDGHNQLFHKNDENPGSMSRCGIRTRARHRIRRRHMTETRDERRSSVKSDQRKWRLISAPPRTRWQPKSHSS